MASNPHGRRRRERSDVALNRSKLVEAARDLFARDPNAEMGEIAAAAGVARSTAYRHFATREELLGAVRTQVRDDAEANDEEHLRPPGELADLVPSPLSVTEVLNKVPPFQLGDQIVAEAQRLDGVTSAAVYLIDLEGSTMQRLAGPGTFPDRISVPLAVGPEIPREGVAPLRALIEDLLPGAVVAPMYLRGRATGVLMAVGAAGDALRDLAAEAAAALGLAVEYTDHIDSVRRLRPTSPAAEIQQHLLPPRILRIGGALIAGNVLPGYDIGGDWFDCAENHECAWIGISDTTGRGPAAAGLGTVTLGAFRAARQRSADPARAVTLMHEVLSEVAREAVTATATIASWNGPTSSVSWLTCGEHAPILVGADGAVEVLGDGVLPALGDSAMPGEKAVQRRRLGAGERLLLLSDGVLDRPTVEGGTLGLDGIRRAVAKAPADSAAGTLRAIEDAVRAAIEDPLSDDATVVVLVPSRTAPG
ncbi:PP2C family protein-serine/threonine phosphatase [Candidatus Solirubrobacter pratensis]|uniref:PP2C family protein-serine/threonine phosphatase n=1 Tax=Candidatus Solirubrobacter pratensis TaxID=1298857 RepID=UPI0004195F3F|nr:SpoIIE family protein phosphatase [Candidatus Solirubrobacter pratensis]